jgi:hypothetical protein
MKALYISILILSAISMLIYGHKRYRPVLELAHASFGDMKLDKLFGNIKWITFFKFWIACIYVAYCIGIVVISYDSVLVLSGIKNYLRDPIDIIKTMLAFQFMLIMLVEITRHAIVTGRVEELRAEEAMEETEKPY